MAEQQLRRTPLADAAGRLAEVTRAAGGAIAIAEVPFRTQLNLRVDPASPAAAAAGKELGLELPTEAGTSARAGDLSVLWLGPDEWLIIAAPGAAEQVTGRLRSAFGTEYASVVDVSAQRTTLHLGGPRVRDVLAQGCALDLHPSRFPVGRCAQTMLAQAPVILLPLAADEYWLLVRASFARYLADWLFDATVEYR